MRYRLMLPPKTENGCCSLMVVHSYGLAEPARRAIGQQTIRRERGSCRRNGHSLAGCPSRPSTLKPNGGTGAGSTRYAEGLV
jgi:hypothetical protein